MDCYLAVQLAMIYQFFSINDSIEYCISLIIIQHFYVSLKISSTCFRQALIIEEDEGAWRYSAIRAGMLDLLSHESNLPNRPHRMTTFLVLSI